MKKHLLYKAALITIATLSISASPAALAAESDCNINSPVMNAVYENTLRTQDDKAKDLHRRPDIVLKFWGIEQDDKIVDLEAGAGYYTRILSQYLKDGHVTAVNGDLFVENARFSDRIESIKATDEARDNVSRIVGRFDEIDLPDNVDGVMFVNFYHDTIWLGYDRKAMNDEIFKSLKSGGTYLVMDHAAEEGAGFAVGKTLHRVEGQSVIDEIEQSGFKLIKQSDALMREDDVLTQSAVKVEERRGRTARFIYLFQKP